MNGLTILGSRRSTILLLTLAHLLYAASLIIYVADDRELGPLGLARNYSAFYWSSVLILICVAVSQVSPRKWTSTSTVLGTLMVTLLYTPLVLQSNSRIGSLWPAGLAVPLEAEGHLSLGAVGANNIYFFYPLQPLLTCVTRLALGLELEVIAKFAPFVLLAIIAVIVYVTFHRWNSPFPIIAGCLFILFWWHSQSYWSPQMLALVYVYLYVAVLYHHCFVATSTAKVFVLFLLFLCIFLAHPLTAFFALLLTLALAIFGKGVIKKRATISYLCLLLFITSGAYTLYVAGSYFAFKLPHLLGWYVDIEKFVYSIFWGRGDSLGSDMYKTIFYCRVVFLLLFGVGLAKCLTSYLRSRSNPVALFGLAVFVSALAVNGIAYTGESMERAYIFALIPAAYWAAKPLQRCGILPLLLVLIALSFTFHVADNNNKPFAATPTQDLAGARHLGTYSAPSTVIYTEVVSDFLFYQPDRDVNTLMRYYTEMRLREFSWDMDIDYLIYSNRQKAMYEYNIGYYPLDDERLDKWDLSYMTKDFHVYAKPR